MGEYRAGGEWCAMQLTCAAHRSTLRCSRERMGRTGASGAVAVAMAMVVDMAMVEWVMGVARMDSAKGAVRAEGVAEAVAAMVAKSAVARAEGGAAAVVATSVVAAVGVAPVVGALWEEVRERCGPHNRSNRCLTDKTATRCPRRHRHSRHRRHSRKCLYSLGRALPAVTDVAVAGVVAPAMPLAAAEKEAIAVAVAEVTVTAKLVVAAAMVTAMSAVANTMAAT